jgi:hypothetical protein
MQGGHLKVHDNEEIAAKRRRVILKGRENSVCVDMIDYEPEPPAVSTDPEPGPSTAAATATGPSSLAHAAMRQREADIKELVGSKGSGQIPQAIRASVADIAADGVVALDAIKVCFDRFFIPCVGCGQLRLAPPRLACHCESFMQLGLKLASERMARDEAQIKRARAADRLEEHEQLHLDITMLTHLSTALRDCAASLQKQVTDAAAAAEAKREAEQAAAGPQVQKTMQPVHEWQKENAHAISPDVLGVWLKSPAFEEVRHTHINHV